MLMAEQEKLQRIIYMIKVFLSCFILLHLLL